MGGKNKTELGHLNHVVKIQPKTLEMPGEHTSIQSCCGLGYCDVYLHFLGRCMSVLQRTCSTAYTAIV